jgi:phosphoribosylaminoimidazole-succinocarboxamide synthase
METVYSTNFDTLKLKHRGKVRDIYELKDYLLFVASDRISAFDLIMDEPIPGKGAILSEISVFWFDATKHIIPNHFVTNNVNEYPEECRQYASQLEGRSMLVKKCKPLPVEFIVRGYVAGSGWKEYKKSRTICGIPLTEGLLEFSKLPEPIFTPSTKADVGHDENINFEKASEILGFNLTQKLRDTAIELYRFGADYLEKQNIILADTKFEFGTDSDGAILLIDEALTPDSSRFWLKEEYEPGKPQVQFDKQTLRDYLESLTWGKEPPPPSLPDFIVERIKANYLEAHKRITGK